MLWIIILALAVIILLWLFLSKESPVVFVDRQRFRQRKAEEYLKEHKTITNQTYRKLVGVSQSQATRDLDELERREILKQIGKSGPKVTYKRK